jgi:hypothetical protein
LWFSSVTDQKREIVEEILWNFGFQIEPGKSSIYQGFTGNECNIDITALRKCSGTK